MTLPYEQRQEARRERLEERADKAQAEADARSKAASAIYDHIPLGQPILVGHHSEKRHRRDLKRAESNMRKGVEAAKAAAELARRAAAVGTAGISSDDPEAVAKLKTKLNELEVMRDRMKAVNSAFRKAEGGAAAKLAACVTAGLLSEEDGARIARVTFGLCRHDKPFPPFELSNIGGRIRAAQKRVEQLQAQAAAAPRDAIERETALGVVRIEENRELNRVQIIFPMKPNETIRASLKQYGFHFAPSESAWQRQLSHSAWYRAQKLVETLPAPRTPAPPTQG